MSDELAALIAKRFICRRDVKTEQQKSGTYIPSRHPWTMDDICDHLSGTRTYGHYLVDEAGMSKMFAFDIDLVHNAVWLTPTSDAGRYELTRPRDDWLANDNPEKIAWLTFQLRCMADSLAGRIETMGYPVAIAVSGSKGLHVYALTGKKKAQLQRELAVAVLESFGSFSRSRGQNFWTHTSDGYTGYPALEIEVYPKQDEVRPDGGLGNLLRLPLGINRKSGKPGFFIDRSASYLELRELDPMVALSA